MKINEGYKTPSYHMIVEIGKMSDEAIAAEIRTTFDGDDKTRLRFLKDERNRRAARKMHARRALSGSWD